MKLQLVNSPIDVNYSKSLRTGVYPPLNLAVLSGYIKKYLPDTQIELLDGEIQDINTILNSIEAEFVGISCNVLTYNSALEIAKKAKTQGSYVFLGGPYPTVLSKEILQNNPFIDSIVFGDGEKAILQLLEGNRHSDISNLCYRLESNIVKNPINLFDINEFVLPDYMNLPLVLYFSNFRSRYGHYKPFNASLPIYSIKGCKWRNTKKGGCIFCMIPHKGFKTKNGSNLMNEIIYFNELYGVDSFWEVSDSFLDHFEFVNDLIKLKKENIQTNFHIYGRASQLLNTERVKLLKKANIYEVFVGAESGDDEILRNMNKGNTVEQTYTAIKNLNRFGIKATVSFVLGLPGESQLSLDKTLKFAEKISNLNNVNETSTSIMLPIPGSKAFDMLKNKLGIPYSDKYDLEFLKQKWIKHFTNVDYEVVNEYVDELTSFFPLNNSFAQPETLTAPYC